MSDDTDVERMDETLQPKEPQISFEEQLDSILVDPQKKAALLLKAGLDEPIADKSKDRLPNRDESHHLTPSGKTTGGWPYPPFWPPYPYPPAPFPGYPPYMDPCNSDPWHSRGSRSRHSEDLPGPSGALIN